ncbi:MAG: ABC transporter ATP-binding protein/permease [Deltaproteobacteria bacterium]|jgi:ATP-binding cassette subfamily B protein|nr:ABC transporter ATP-binding protein/permease [Deltaproteobacteria bacterium]
MSHTAGEKNALARLIELSGEKKTLLLWSFILSTISVALMLLPYYSVYIVLLELLRHAPDPSLMNGEEMIRWAVLGLAGLLGGYAFMYAGAMCSHVAAFRILYGIRVRLSDHIGRLPLGFFDRNASGKIKKVAEMDVEKIELFIAHQLPDLVNAALLLAAMLAGMFFLNPWLALAAVIPIIIGFAAQYSLMLGKECQKAISDFYDALEEISASSVQYVRGMPSVKVFGQTVFSFRRFHADMLRYRDFCIRFGDKLQNGYALFKVLLVSLPSFILPVGLFLLSREPENVAFAAVLTLFLVFAPGVSVPMLKFVSLAGNFSMIAEGVRRIDSMLAQAPLPDAVEGRVPESFDVRFERVSFSYDAEGGAPEVLHEVSFTAGQNALTALVGPSGSGKTTLAQLIPRFWDVRSGSVSIGGVDIRDIPAKALMDMVSFVFQDAFLFSDSLHNNILIGRPSASPEEVRAAAEAAQCREFIEALPQGFDTLIGEGGVHLSGGEEQRVCVARAILKNAPILVLDEATAYADPTNEHLMQQALSRLMRGKTVIIIAHRLSTIRKADAIFVLRNGSVAEAGTHEALLEADGIYAKMWNAHRQALNWKIGRENSHA